MFLTRFEINPARRGARQLLGSPQAMHAAVLAAFPPSEHEKLANNEGGPRILWRVDRSNQPQATRLFIASPGEPDLTHLVEQAGWPATAGWESRPYVGLLDRLTAGQTWAFRLKANPVHSVRMTEGERTKPLGHVTEQQQRTWLTARTAKYGFAIESDGADVLVRDRDVIRFRRGTSTVTLATATFDGMLTITDTEALRRALTHGIGRAKGYGCGMLTLAPPP